MIWICSNCGTKGDWSYLDLAERGTPICNDCHNEMQICYVRPEKITTFRQLFDFLNIEASNKQLDSELLVKEGSILFPVHLLLGDNLFFGE